MGMNEQDFVCQCPLDEEEIRDYFENGIHNHPSLINQQVHIVENHNGVQYGLGMTCPLDHQEEVNCYIFMKCFDKVIDAFAEGILGHVIENGSATIGNVIVLKNIQLECITIRHCIS